VLVKSIYSSAHGPDVHVIVAACKPITIAQMLGHSSSQIVPRYAQVLDQNRLDALKKLVLLRESTVSIDPASQATNSEPMNNRIRQ